MYTRPGRQWRGLPGQNAVEGAPCQTRQACLSAPGQLKLSLARVKYALTTCKHNGCPLSLSRKARKERDGDSGGRGALLMRPASHSWGQTRNDRRGPWNSEQNVFIAGCAHNSSSPGENYAVRGRRKTARGKGKSQSSGQRSRQRHARGVCGPAVERNAVRQSVTLLRFCRRAPLGSLGSTRCTATSYCMYGRSHRNALGLDWLAQNCTVETVYYPRKKKKKQLKKGRGQNKTSTTDDHRPLCLDT